MPMLCLYGCMPKVLIPMERIPSVDKELELESPEHRRHRGADSRVVPCCNLSEKGPTNMPSLGKARGGRTHPILRCGQGRWELPPMSKNVAGGALSSLYPIDGPRVLTHICKRCSPHRQPTQFRSARYPVPAGRRSLRWRLWLHGHCRAVWQSQRRRTRVDWYVVPCSVPCASLIVARTNATVVESTSRLTEAAHSLVTGIHSIIPRSHPQTCTLAHRTRRWHKSCLPWE